MNTIIFEAPQELQPYAVFKAQQALGINKRALSKPDAYNAALTAIESGESFPLVMAKYEMDLSDTHVSEFEHLSQKKEARAASARASKIFEDAFARSGIGNKKGEKPQLKMEYDERIRNAKNPHEVAREAFILLAPKTKEGWLGTRTQITAFEALQEDIPRDKLEFAIPARAKKIIYDSYLEDGIDLKDQEHMDIYFDNGTTAEAIYQMEYIKNFSKLTRFSK